MDNTHAFSASTGTGLDEQGKSDALCFAALCKRSRPRRPRCREPWGCYVLQPPLWRRVFDPMTRMACGRGPTKEMPAFSTASANSLRVFRSMNGVRAGVNGVDALDNQIAFVAGRAGPTQMRSTPGRAVHSLLGASPHGRTCETAISPRLATSNLWMGCVWGCVICCGCGRR